MGIIYNYSFYKYKIRFTADFFIIYFYYCFLKKYSFYWLKVAFIFLLKFKNFFTQPNLVSLHKIVFKIALKSILGFS